MHMDRQLTSPEVHVTVASAQSGPARPVPESLVEALTESASPEFAASATSRSAAMWCTDMSIKNPPGAWLRHHALT